jgi:hypothetical protein
MCVCVYVYITTEFTCIKTDCYNSIFLSLKSEKPVLQTIYVLDLRFEICKYLMFSMLLNIQVFLGFLDVDS